MFRIGPHLTTNVWNTILEAHGLKAKDRKAAQTLRERIAFDLRAALVADTNRRLEELGSEKRLQLYDRHKNKIIMIKLNGENKDE